MCVVQFEIGKACFKEEFKEVLDQIVKIMQCYLGYVFVINGYIDNVGDVENNKILFEDCVCVCYVYLVSEGILLKWIFFQGFGEEQLIVMNDIWFGCMLNCWVEFNFYIE